MSTKRTFGLTTLLSFALVSAALSSTAAVLVSRAWIPRADVGHPHDEAEAALYQCPMHPSIVQDHPGNCPICGMKLVKVEKAIAEVPSADAATPRLLFYRSPMNPKQTSPTPRKDEMGMDYIPVYEDAPGNAPMVSGHIAVEIDPARQQLIGLKTVEVTHGPIAGAWRTVGRVAIDETRVRHVNLKVSGFVERIYVDFVGKKVRKGDPLFTLYSPELLSAQEEYLLALRTRGELAKLGGAISKDDGSLAKSARRKLELWDIPPSTLDEIVKTGEPTKTLTFFSPVTGVITKKDVVQGMKLDAGAMPYEIVDLSSVWVLADVYESELRFVKDGMPANLMLAAFPNRDFQGKVAFLDPMLNPQTRTVTVRMSFPNPMGDLRPEMFGEVILQGSPHDGLRIPPDAVIDSGTEKIAFVAVGEGKFEPRRVNLGASDGAHVEVLRGLTQGERVVIRANFLVDSESRLRASLAEMSVGATTPKGPESARVLPALSDQVFQVDSGATPPDRSSADPPRAHPMDHGEHTP